MSLLTMVQGVSTYLGLPKPNQIVGNTDPNIVQLLEIANTEGEDLASRYQWQALVKEGTFTLSLAENQGDINGTVITDEDFEYILNDTFWDRTTSLPVPGPLSSTDWQTLKSFPVTGPYFQYRIQGNQLKLDPTPTTANSMAFEYKSKFWCEDSGGTGQAEWGADTDVGRLDEPLMKLGIRWRWLQRHGLAYAEDMRTYETRVANAMMRDGGKSRLKLNNRAMRRSPGVFVPQGSWDL